MQECSIHWGQAGHEELGLIGKSFFLLQDLRGLLGVESFEQLEEALWIEGFDAVVGSMASVFAHRDDGEPGLQLFEFLDQLAAGDVGDGDVEDDAVNAREFFEGLDGFGSAVGSDDVELRGLDDELAGGDGAGVFAVDDEEAGPEHVGLILAEGTFVEGWGWKADADCCGSSEAKTQIPFGNGNLGRRTTNEGTNAGRY